MENKNTIAEFFLLFFLFIIPMFVWNLYFWWGISEIRSFIGNTTIAQFFDENHDAIYFSLWAILSIFAASFTLVLRKHFRQKEKLWSWFALMYSIFLVVSVLAFFLLINYPIFEALGKAFISLLGKFHQMTDWVEMVIS